MRIDCGTTDGIMGLEVIDEGNQKSSRASARASIGRFPCEHDIVNPKTGELLFPKGKMMTVRRQDARGSTASPVWKIRSVHDLPCPQRRLRPLLRHPTWPTASLLTSARPSVSSRHSPSASRVLS